MNIRHSFSVFFAATILFFTLSCSSSSVLRVTPEHQEYLRHVDDDVFRDGSIERLFTNLSVESDKICNMILEYSQYDAATAQSFSTTLNFQKTPKQKWYDNVIPSLIAGCFNFYKMNDRGVHTVFALLEKLYPEPKDCYTVGFSQYYLMRQFMHCDRLTAIDADWRILKAHYDFHQQIRRKNSDADTLSLLRNVELAWVAHFDIRPESRESVRNEVNFCMQTERAYCLRAFDAFVALPELPKSELLLGFIHDAEFKPRRNNLSVVFASNALDVDYTSQEKFDKMLTAMKNYLPEGKRVAVIYQAGDSEDIAVYEMLKGENDTFEVSIRCRDNIRWSDRYIKKMRDKPIVTWFDKLLDYRSLKGVPWCHAGGTRRFITDPSKKKI